MKYPQINYIIQSVSHDTITKDEKIIPVVEKNNNIVREEHISTGTIPSGTVEVIERSTIPDFLSPGRIGNPK